MNRVVLGAALGVSGLAAIVYPIWTRDRNELKSLDNALKLDKLLKDGLDQYFEGGYFRPWEVWFGGDNKIRVFTDRPYYINVTSCNLTKMDPERPLVVDVVMEYIVNHTDISNGVNRTDKKGKFVFVSHKTLEQNLCEFAKNVEVTYKS